ncbi:hypothetical protein [Ornithinimicrobium kibberense]|uniref:hypothetical protein n=1 Tax=Ornithinimicrobium kibberense TaxID=282060 RepID=UPI00361C0443
MNPDATRTAAAQTRWPETSSQMNTGRPSSRTMLSTLGTVRSRSVTGRTRWSCRPSPVPSLMGPPPFLPSWVQSRAGRPPAPAHRRGDRMPDAGGAVPSCGTAPRAYYLSVGLTGFEPATP